MSRRISRIAPPAMLAIVVCIAGCGSDGPHISAYQMTHPQIIPNKKSNNPDAFYVPNPITVHVGQSITWINKDSDDIHNVISTSGTFESTILPTGGTFTWTPTKPGRYPYFCTLHPNMHGIIIVKPK